MTKLLWEIEKDGRTGVKIPERDVPKYSPVGNLPESMLRKSPNGLPQVSEPQVVRHFVELSTKNHHVDKGFYPLGSCTMKYNPKLTERLACLAGFTGLHPHTPD